MKVISMYLPQFHRVKENDEWWGEGFTEWTAVKGAEKFFETQYQPHVPLENNYYDLLNQETMKWQAALMKEYKVDGQCFYHYWFKDGRQILEKPAENLLRWNEIDMPFCFCWANETWARSWSKLKSVNPWAFTYEKKENKSGAGILLEQKYGDEEQWKKHFDYLLPFFKDKRYIKIKGKPVFVIYKSAQISCLREMMEKWNEWARKQGLEGMYVIGANSNSSVDSYLDGILYHEPQYTIGKNAEKGCGSPLRLKCDLMWRESLSYQSIKENAIYGGFVGYDDSPRRGKTGVVFENADPEKFRIYLTELLAKNAANGNKLIFLNAWNEWGEGMHLEPDEKYQYEFLKAIPYAKEHYKDFFSKYQNDYLMKNQSYKKEIAMWSKKCVRYESYWRILDAWFCMKENGISLGEYFAEKDIDSIAIYGMGMLGKHLLNELKNEKVEVRYAIDQKAKEMSTDLKMYSPEDDFPEIEAIVVTATYAFSEIKVQLVERGYFNIISLEEIIFEMNGRLIIRGV